MLDRVKCLVHSAFINLVLRVRGHYALVGFTDSNDVVVLLYTRKQGKVWYDSIIMSARLCLRVLHKHAGEKVNSLTFRGPHPTDVYRSMEVYEVPYWAVQKVTKELRRMQPKLEQFLNRKELP